MGYQIQYGVSMVKTHISERKKIRISRKGAAIFITILASLLAVVLGSRKEVQDYLIPGNSQVTRAAMTKMITDLKDGKPLAASFDAFCREIIDGANIPE